MNLLPSFREQRGSFFFLSFITGSNPESETEARFLNSISSRKLLSALWLIIAPSSKLLKGPRRLVKVNAQLYLRQMNIANLFTFTLSRDAKPYTPSVRELQTDDTTVITTLVLGYIGPELVHLV